MTKRILSGALWLFAGWYLGNLVAFQFGLSDWFGPVLGIVAAVIVAGDPFGLLWARAAVGSAPDADPAGSTATN